MVIVDAVHDAGRLGRRVVIGADGVMDDDEGRRRLFGIPGHVGLVGAPLRARDDVDGEVLRRRRCGNGGQQRAQVADACSAGSDGTTRSRARTVCRGLIRRGGPALCRLVDGRAAVARRLPRNRFIGVGVLIDLCLRRRIGRGRRHIVRIQRDLALRVAGHHGDGQVGWQVDGFAGDLDLDGVGAPRDEGFCGGSTDAVVPAGAIAAHGIPVRPPAILAHANRDLRVGGELLIGTPRDPGDEKVVVD